MLEQAQSIFKTVLATFLPTRTVGAFKATVTIEETGNDELEITSHPVQQGASITDHAYLKPSILTIRAVYGDTPANLAETYKKLLKLQADRVPMKVITGKRTYNNMLVRSLSQLTDSNTENSLQISFELVEVFITAVEVVTLPPRERQAQADKTGSTEHAGKKQAGAVDPAKQESKKSKSVMSKIGGAF
ncbi:MAG: hypothetical protein FJ119_13115 [Deltaproteobacteria bacterium]|nr:hypothetical protein [Deltaproteobacteria bacterium]